MSSTNDNTPTGLTPEELTAARVPKVDTLRDNPALKATFDFKEMATALSNMTIMAKRPSGPDWDRTKGIPDARVSNLRRSAEAFLEVMDEFIEEEAIRPAEAVFVFVSLAMMTQMKHVMGRLDIMPKGVISQQTLETLKRLISETKSK